MVAQTTAGNSSTYTVQNSRYKTHAATSNIQPDGSTYASVVGDQRRSTAISLVYDWRRHGYMLVHSTLKFLAYSHRFSPISDFDTSWNVQNGYSNGGNPVNLRHYLETYFLNPYFRDQIIFYPLSNDTSNVIWIFNSVTSSSTSAATSSASFTSTASNYART